MRRLLALTSTMILLDVAFYAAIAPLLPEYVDELGLSEAEAGVLVAAYAAGMLLASLPAGWVASRIGPRRTVVCGLVLLAGSSLVFGLANQILLLDAARFLQGIAGALIWAGALTWLIAAAPSERRGSMIGTALATAVAGTLLGPVLGALAAAIGTEPVFTAIFVLALGLALVAARIPDAHVRERQDPGRVRSTLLSRPLLEAAGFVAVPSLTFGALGVLVPLRIDELGGGHGVIAAGFIAAAAVEAVLALIAGRLSDRVGRRRPLVVGLSICAATMAAFALAHSLAGVLAVLILASVGVGFCFAPAITLVSDVAEGKELHQGFAAGVSTMAWAAGQVIGGVLGGGAASLAGEAVPTVAIAIVLLGTVAYALRVLPVAPGPAVAEAP